jgi:uncharacterized repeat protein (TIGR01451 family)
MEIDLGALFPDIPEVAGLIFRLPDVNFVAPGTQLVAGEETTAPLRVPVTFVGIDNHTDPGLTLTESYNPVTTVQLTNTIDGTPVEANDQTFLLDTGAQLSVISTAIAVQLGLDLDNPDLTIDVGGAGGTATIPGFTIESLTLPRDDDNDGVIDGELVFTSVPIFVLDLGVDIDGILGMNLLNTMSQMVYDPNDPDGAGPGGPSLQFTFSTAPREEYSEEDLENLGLLMPMFAGTLGGRFLPQFITPAMVVPDQLAVSVVEGQPASNTGTFDEPNGNTVTITASVGSISQSGGSSGTWSWSLLTTPADGPTTPVMVTITADAGPAGVQSTTFTYTVQNVAPTISLSGDAEVNAQAVYELELGAVTDPGVDTVISYRVNWGDGTPPTDGGSPTGQIQHTYAVGGVDRTITVDLIDEDGTHLSAGSKTIHVNAAPAVSANNSAVSAVEGQGQSATNTGVFSDADGNTVQLSASSGTVTPTSISTWSWSLAVPDGPAGPVTVTITADDGHGGIATTTFTYTVQNVAPTISLSGNAEVNAQAVYELHLGAVTDPGIDTVSSYRVNWGDGTSTPEINGSPNGQTQQHTYAVGGVDRTITVDLFDEDGEHLSAGSKTIHVNAAPAVSADNPTVSAVEGQSATNTGVFSDADGNAVQLSASTGTVTPGGNGTWSWSLNVADGPAGPVTVTITADDGHGGIATTTFTYTVQNVTPTISLSGAAQASALANYQLSLGSIVDPGADTVAGYEIHWGDGTATGFVAGSPAGQTLGHVYAVAGVQRVITVDLHDEDGAHLAVASKTVAVLAPNLTVTQTRKPAVVARGGTISFRINIANIGSVLASGAFVTYQLPAGISFVRSGSTPGWRSIGPRTFRLDLGALDPNQIRQVIFKGRVANSMRPGRNLTTIALVGDDGLHGPDFNLADNSARIRTRVR